MGRFFVFQVVHGPPGEIDHNFPQVLAGWRIFSSSCVSGDGSVVAQSGGVVVAICPLLGSLCSFVEEVIISGRCIVVSILRGG